MYARRVLSLRPPPSPYGLWVFVREASQFKKSPSPWGSVTRDPHLHLKEKIRKLEGQKTGKVPLRSEERAMKEMDFPLFVDSLGKVIADYVPHDQHAKAPFYTREGLKQRYRDFKESLKSTYGVALIKRKLKRIEPFKPIEFSRWAQDQFIDANVALMKRDTKVLREITTVTASGQLRTELHRKQLKWKFMEEVERPRIVSVRMAPLDKKKSIYAQVVVRVHTRQISSLHDMAGRLLDGHLTKPRDVIDYVVFERSLTRKGSTWRICGKLPPHKTYQQTKSLPAAN